MAAESPPGARRLAAALLVNALGNGLYITTSTLFFVRSAGLSALQLGLGLGGAGVVGLVAGAPLGHLADRLGPRRVYVALLAAQAVGTAWYPAVSGFGAFAVAVSLVTAVERGAGAARGALIARLVPRADRVRFRAVLRSVSNLGVAVGAAAGSLVLAWESRAAYVAAIETDAVTFVIAAAIVASIPQPRSSPVASAAPRTRAAADVPFLAVTALNAVLLLHTGMVEIGIPLWIAERTSAPRWLVSAVVVVNTLAVIAFQVRASRGADTLPGAVAAARRGGVLLAAACCVLALAAGRPALAASVLILCAAVLHVGGELAQAAAAWGLVHELAPDHAQGQYQGVFNAGMDLGALVAPLVFAGIVTGWGGAGWLALGAVFVASGYALAPVSRWAAARRPATTGATTAVVRGA